MPRQVWKVNSLCFALLQFKKIRQDAKILSRKENDAKLQSEKEVFRCWEFLSGSNLTQFSRLVQEAIS